MQRVSEIRQARAAGRNARHRSGGLMKNGRARRFGFGADPGLLMGIVAPVMNGNRRSAPPRLDPVAAPAALIPGPRPLDVRNGMLRLGRPNRPLMAARPIRRHAPIGNHPCQTAGRAVIRRGPSLSPRACRAPVGKALRRAAHCAARGRAPGRIVQNRHVA